MSAVRRCWEGRTNDDNREYLEKMFQATLAVPLPKPESLRGAISRQLEQHQFPDHGKSAKIIENLLEPNPRKIKNFCNSLCASWRLLHCEAGIEKLPIKFILLHYLRTFHNPVWRLLERQPYALFFLYRVLVGTAPGETIVPPKSQEENPIFKDRTQRVLEMFFKRAFSHILAHDGTGKDKDEELHLGMPLDQAVSLFTARQDRKRSDEYFRALFESVFIGTEHLEDVFLYLPERAST